MRPAFPAAANALIASSSEFGAKYRSSVMVVRDLPFFCPPHMGVGLFQPAVAPDYTAKPARNSLRAAVLAAGSYAPIALAPVCCRIDGHMSRLGLRKSCARAVKILTFLILRAGDI
jgi:hypothetical protein